MENLRKHLKLSEGFRDTAYMCPAGKLTIGYGFNIEDRGLPKKVADFWLDYEIDVMRSELSHACGNMKFFENISDARFDVLIDMSFNMGVPRLLGFSKMFKALDKGNYDKAADEMLDSRWARQVKGRAVRLSEAMRTGIWDF
jgi:lysozyme